MDLQKKINKKKHYQNIQKQLERTPQNLGQGAFQKPLRTPILLMMGVGVLLSILNSPFFALERALGETDLHCETALDPFAPDPSDTSIPRAKEPPVLSPGVSPLNDMLKKRELQSLDQVKQAIKRLEERILKEADIQKTDISILRRELNDAQFLETLDERFPSKRWVQKHNRWWWRLLAFNIRNFPYVWPLTSVWKLWKHIVGLNPFLPFMIFPHNNPARLNREKALAEAEKNLAQIDAEGGQQILFLKRNLEGTLEAISRMQSMANFGPTERDLAVTYYAANLKEIIDIIGDHRDFSVPFPKEKTMKIRDLIEPVQINMRRVGVQTRLNTSDYDLALQEMVAFLTQRDMKKLLTLDRMREPRKRDQLTQLNLLGVLRKSQEKDIRAEEVLAIFKDIDHRIESSSSERIRSLLDLLRALLTRIAIQYPSTGRGIVETLEGLETLSQTPELRETLGPMTDLELIVSVGLMLEVQGGVSVLKWSNRLKTLREMDFLNPKDPPLLSPPALLILGRLSLLTPQLRTENPREFLEQTRDYQTFFKVNDLAAALLVTLNQTEGAKKETILETFKEIRSIFENKLEHTLPDEDFAKLTRTAIRFKLTPQQLVSTIKMANEIAGTALPIPVLITIVEKNQVAMERDRLRLQSLQNSQTQVPNAGDPETQPDLHRDILRGVMTKFSDIHPWWTDLLVHRENLDSQNLSTRTESPSPEMDSEEGLSENSDQDSQKKKRWFLDWIFPKKFTLPISELEMGLTLSNGQLLGTSPREPDEDKDLPLYPPQDAMAIQWEEARGLLANQTALEETELPIYLNPIHYYLSYEPSILSLPTRTPTAPSPTNNRTQEDK